MRIVRCDKCKTDLPNKDAIIGTQDYLRLEVRSVPTLFNLGDVKLDGDLCSQCVDKLKDWLHEV